MAKIVITINTSDKSLNVSIDGTKIENVKSVSAYQFQNSDGTPSGIDATVNVIEKGPSDDVNKETSYYAAGSVEAKKIIQTGKAVYNKNIPNFISKSVEAQVQDDIAAFLGQKLGRK